MTGTTSSSSSSSSSSPCGACKFLRRKCVRGCVFAPHFCYEQGSSHFAAIHKVFGASNASKILSHLPPLDRIEAAVTISYEAQARLQDPVYGCVSHIFALQQQVVNLQAQLASLKEQLTNENVESQIYPDHQDVQSWLHNNQRAKMPLFDGSDFNLDNCIGPNRGIPEDNASFGSMESLEMQYSNEHESGGKWRFQDNRDDLQSLAFGYNYNTHQLS